MIKKIHVKKGETVMVVSGKDKNKKGKVLVVMPKTGKVIVEGINVATKHTKARKQGDVGGIVKQEAPINISNLSLIDPKSGKATRVAIKHDGKNVIRIAKKSGEEIK